ncbi:hypothetical protein BaRGS_00009882 [Batillaria attramentaria]|uniref:Uncharacterized protein n=1 Tax=Batillaria attramentaria TaxID=370345 RepID=A0ABD0LHB7_9CAEN
MLVLQRRHENAVYDNGTIESEQLDAVTQFWRVPHQVTFPAKTLRRDPISQLPCFPPSDFSSLARAAASVVRGLVGKPLHLEASTLHRRDVHALRITGTSRKHHRVMLGKREEHHVAARSLKTHGKF